MSTSREKKDSLSGSRRSRLTSMKINGNKKKSVPKAHAYRTKRKKLKG